MQFNNALKRGYLDWQCLELAAASTLSVLEMTGGVVPP